MRLPLGLARSLAGNAAVGVGTRVRHPPVVQAVASPRMPSRRGPNRGLWIAIGIGVAVLVVVGVVVLLSRGGSDDIGGDALDDQGLEAAGDGHRDQHHGQSPFRHLPLHDHRAGVDRRPAHHGQVPGRDHDHRRGHGLRLRRDVGHPPGPLRGHPEVHQARPRPPPRLDDRADGVEQPAARAQPLGVRMRRPLRPVHEGPDRRDLRRSVHPGHQLQHHQLRDGRPAHARRRRRAGPHRAPVHPVGQGRQPHRQDHRGPLGPSGQRPHRSLRCDPDRQGHHSHRPRDLQAEVPHQAPRVCSPD